MENSRGVWVGVNRQFKKNQGSTQLPYEENFIWEAKLFVAHSRSMVPHAMGDSFEWKKLPLRSEGKLDSPNRNGCKREHLRFLCRRVDSMLAYSRCKRVPSQSQDPEAHIRVLLSDAYLCASLALRPIRSRLREDIVREFPIRKIGDR